MVLVWNQEEGVKPRSIGSELAKRLKVDTAKVAQPLEIPIYSEELFIEPVIQGIGGDSPGPGPIQGGYKEIVVSVSQQSLWAYEDGMVVAATLVSTGTGNVPETETPRGQFSILVKFEVETMDGVIAGEEYLVEDVPWVMYFDNNGNALHGTYWHSNFGYRMSHGCVNLPMDVAAFLYDWAPIGTAVTVID
jgi:lipoprotein-anchoring transpeptidase ErfK/SrfK